MKKVVLIGGGTGMPTLLRILKNFPIDLTAIVAVTDSGRSSGKLRDELGILPPGDIRNCIASLSESEQVMRDILQYRFNSSSYNGASLGNLMIAALTDIYGGFEKAIEEISRIFAIKGKVLPSTLENIHLCAELENNETIIKEHNVRKPDKAPIRKVYFDKQAKANPKVIKEIQEADLIVLGPGSLYTSIISSLLVQGISETINNSKAKKIYILNIMTQPGQTDNYTAKKHLEEIEKYLQGKIDIILLNNSKLSPKLIEAYKQEQAQQVIDDLPFDEKIIRDDFIEKNSGIQQFWEKKNLLRHNEKVGEVFIKLLYL